MRKGIIIQANNFDLSDEFAVEDRGVLSMFLGMSQGFKV